MSTMKNWTEKYRPKFLADLKGQEQAVVKLREFLEHFGRPRSKNALALHGPPGVGKTTLAHVAANELGFELFELNASDLRNKDKLHEILRPATEQRSLMKKGKIILVDEVDGISGVDRGGLTELIRLIESTSHPLILTANDIWDRKFSPLRKKIELVQLKEIDYRTIKGILIEILRKEKKFISLDVLTNISLKSKGDLRAAINDLQTASELEDPSQIMFDERNKETDIFNALRMIFKGKANNSQLGLFDSVKMPLDEIILWIEENLPSEYQGEELARAANLMSKIDIFRKRIFRQQYWRFLVYQNAFLSYGISSAKKPDADRIGFTSYKKPTRILKVWLNNQKNIRKKSIAQKYAKYVHIGEKRALKEFPEVISILLNPKVQKELKLTEEEIGYLASN